MKNEQYLDSDTDTRNVIDEYRGMSVADIKAALDTKRQRFHVAVENLERDFNAGTIIRNANAFNAEAVHFIGKRQWNKRGAMATDHYMNIFYHLTVTEFLAATRGRRIIGVDNVKGSTPLAQAVLPLDAVLVFGSEGNGLSDLMIQACENIVAIEQFGSTRSVNVGVASGIVMYAWLQKNTL